LAIEDLELIPLLDWKFDEGAQMETEGDIGKPVKGLFNSFSQLSLLDQKFNEGAQMETEGDIKKPAKGLFNGFSWFLHKIHKAKSHESQSTWQEPEGSESPVKAKLPHYKPIESCLQLFVATAQKFLINSIALM
jgi:hypothetical protein